MLRTVLGETSEKLNRIKEATRVYIRTFGTGRTRNENSAILYKRVLYPLGAIIFVHKSRMFFSETRMFYETRTFFSETRMFFRRRIIFLA